MAKVLITIDRMDGTTTVKGPLHPGDIDLMGLLFKLNERGIAGVTFTNAEPLTQLLKEEPK